MKISERRLLELSNAYVLNGILKKYRYYDSNMDIQIHNKLNTDETLSLEEFEFIKSLNNVVIETDNYVQFVNFNRTVSKTV